VINLEALVDRLLQLDRAALRRRAIRWRAESRRMTAPANRINIPLGIPQHQKASVSASLPTCCLTGLLTNRLAQGNGATQCERHQGLVCLLPKSAASWSKYEL
jgi:hypothetical protein